MYTVILGRFRMELYMIERKKPLSRLMIGRLTRSGQLPLFSGL